jgi:hypothetical protein
MSLWSVAFLGSTPIGGPLVGLVGSDIGARYALGLGGVAALAAALFGWLAIRRRHIPPDQILIARSASPAMSAPTLPAVAGGAD